MGRGMLPLPKHTTRRFAATLLIIVGPVSFGLGFGVAYECASRTLAAPKTGDGHRIGALKHDDDDGWGRAFPCGNFHPVKP